MLDRAHRIPLMLPRSVLPIGFAGLLLVAWEMGARRNTGGATEMPSLSEVMGILAAHHALLLHQAASTAMECTCGFLLAVGLGILLGGMIAYSSRLSAALYPQIVA